MGSCLEFGQFKTFTQTSWSDYKNMKLFLQSFAKINYILALLHTPKIVFILLVLLETTVDPLYCKWERQISLQNMKNT